MRASVFGMELVFPPPPSSAAAIVTALRILAGAVSTPLRSQLLRKHCTASLAANSPRQQDGCQPRHHMTYDKYPAA